MGRSMNRDDLTKHALHELVRQIDISDYRDGMQHSLKRNVAFLEAKALLDLEAALERRTATGS